MEFFDSHAHLTCFEVFPDIDSILKRAEAAGVSQVLNICTDPDTFSKGLLLKERYPLIHNAAATTPHDVAEEGESFFELVTDAARSRKVVAIGETGLDYHYQHSPKKTQQEFLIRYLQLAQESHLPLIFHCRDAFSDLFAIVDSKCKAVLHCFTGTLQEAEQVLERGWFLSLSGIVTFKKSVVLREVAKMVPLSHLLIETDTPYLAPQSHRAKRNEPAFLVETARCIAEVKGISLQEVASSSVANAKKLLSS